MMSKLYIGNLPNDVTESSLKDLFSDHGVSTSTVTIKRGGYAFVDCADPADIDSAVNSLNGCSYMGHNIVVEPSVAGGAAKKSMLETRVRVSGVPVNSHPEELDNILRSVGEVVKREKYDTRDGVTHVVQVTFDSPETAREASERLNGYSMEGGHTIRVERLSERKPRPERNTNGRPQQGGRGVMGGMGSQHRHAEFPLRILVQSEMVGAIIGRQGATIKQITQQSRARVDVHRKDNAGSLEKAITIYGNPENCTGACKRILEVMQEEADKTSKGGEVSLKILAHNNLIGRIIGKGGATIKKVMEDTDTKITVSSVNDINSFNFERVITIKGNIEDIAKAESAISTKLRQSYESDLQNYSPQTSMFPVPGPRGDRHGGPGMHMGGGQGGMYNNQGGGGAAYPAYPASFGQGHNGYGEQFEETAFLYIPNYSVGAIIGTKGSHIRNIIRFSGASVKINSQENSPEEGIAMSEVPERKVTIVGTPEAQWKSQFLIFEKIRDEYAFGCDDVKLSVEVMIPSSQVGRLIGKGGQNVRDLQRQSGASIKLPQQGASQEEETTVQITGVFYAVQSAQRRIRTMVQPQQPPPPPYMMGNSSGRRSISPRAMMGH